MILAWGIVGSPARAALLPLGPVRGLASSKAGTPRTMGSAQPAIAFATRTFEPPALEIRVNFGMFAGREATPAEIDDLAAVILDKVTEVAIVSEERHEMSAHSEASVHQVRIEVSGRRAPARRTIRSTNCAAG